MTVGILSMQEVKNYGSFLQAFSLKQHIEALGHTCEFVNIVPGEQIGEYQIGKFHKVKLLLLRIVGWDFIKRFKTIYKFQIRFKKEFLPELGVKYETTPNKHYDFVVIGSDEVFNCSQRTWFGFAPQLFGEGLNADKVISYAGSFGATTIEKLEALGLKERVSGYLKKNFAAISVRDENSFNVVKKLTGRTPILNIDPVLLNNWEPYMSTEHVEDDKYLIVYTYPGRITDKNEIKAIKTLATSRGLRIISIGHYFSWVDKVVIPHPFDVLSYFRDADSIVTDTFHGSIFSIKTHRPFCTIVRSMNNNKLTYLLQQLGLEYRIVSDMTKLETIMNTSIDYISVDNIINVETKKSIEYLQQEL